jgi:hypothetical protein
LQVTTTNAYNGNNGRAAIATGTGSYYLVGNAGNGNGSAQTTANTGVQVAVGGIHQWRSRQQRAGRLFQHDAGRQPGGQAAEGQ